MKLANKIALITGGGGGIGRAIAERYATEGAQVVVADIAIDLAQSVADTIGGSAFAVAIDVSSLGGIERCVEEVCSRTGGIDVLVNNAGVFDMAPVLEVSEASWDRMFTINAKGLFFTLQAVARKMKQQGRGGRIINISSQAGRRGEALVSAYCASKAAVISLTQSCALGLIGEGIRVNGIAPGVVDTPMWGQVDALFARYEGHELGEKKRLVGQAVPYGRMGNPGDYAGAAVFLASDDAEYVVAQTLNVDGGNWMS